MRLRGRRRGEFALPVVLLAAVAFVLRLVFVHADGRGPSVLGPGLDSFWYTTVAREIAHGRAIEYFGPQQSLVPTAAHGILFPIVLAAGNRLGAASETAQRLVGCGLGAATVVVAGYAGRELAGARTGLLAAVLVAVYPPFILNDSLLMSEPLYGLLCALAILTSLRLRRSGRLRYAAAFGVVVGLAALTRSEGLLLLPVIGIPMLWDSPCRASRLGAAAACAVLVLAPWAVRNWAVFGRPALTTNSGSVLVGGNCHETYYGARIGGWSPDCLTAASRDGVARDELVQSRRWGRIGRTYLQDHLARAPVIMGARVLRTFSLYPLDPGLQAGVARTVTGGTKGFDVLCVWSALAVMALALLGWRGTTREARLALLPLIALTIVTVALSESLPRLREGADVALLLLGAHVVCLRSGRDSRRRPVAVPGG